VFAGRWAHTWRKFYEVAEATCSPIASEALPGIGELYATKARVRGGNFLLIGLPNEDLAPGGKSTRSRNVSKRSFRMYLFTARSPKSSFMHSRDGEG
jgi:hypothetical protein